MDPVNWFLLRSVTDNSAILDTGRQVLLTVTAWPRTHVLTPSAPRVLGHTSSALRHRVSVPVKCLTCYLPWWAIERSCTRLLFDYGPFDGPSGLISPPVSGLPNWPNSCVARWSVGLIRRHRQNVSHVTCYLPLTGDWPGLHPPTVWLRSVWWSFWADLSSGVRFTKLDK